MHIKECKHGEVKVSAAVQETRLVFGLDSRVEIDDFMWLRNIFSKATVAMVGMRPLQLEAFGGTAFVDCRSSHGSS